MLNLQITCMYESLYAAYDKVIQKEEDERQKRIKSVHSLESINAREAKRQRLMELPAFSSMRMINDDKEASQRNGDNEQQESPASDTKIKRSNGFERMRQCRQALEALDVAGWKRSYHQRLFHEAYIAACARPFWKLDPPGSFARAHQKILDVNNWDNLAQEILISTPRRFGKTISVSMFAAALMFSCAGIDQVQLAFCC